MGFIAGLLSEPISHSALGCSCLIVVFSSLKLYDEGRNNFGVAVMEQTECNQADYLALYVLGLASGAALVLVNICCELSSMASSHHKDILCFPNIRPVTSGGPNDV